MNTLKKAADHSHILLDIWIKELERFEILQNKTNSSTRDLIATMQLALELKLNCQDALSLILKLDRYILDFLGIQPNQSSSINLDRMLFALGHEEIKDLVNIVSLVEGGLSRLLSKGKKNAAPQYKNSAAHEKSLKTTTSLKRVAKLQLHAIMSIQDLQQQIKNLVKYQQVGPVYNEIAALQGPINQFYQAVMHGLGKIQKVCHNIQNGLKIQMSAQLRHIEKELKPFPLYNQPTPSQPVKQFDKPLTHEQLEERARAKRMRPFFS